MQSEKKLSKATYLRKDLLPAEGGGQDQEGQDEFMQSGVGFNDRQNLGSRTVQSPPSTFDSHLDVKVCRVKRNQPTAGRSVETLPQPSSNHSLSAVLVLWPAWR